MKTAWWIAGALALTGCGPTGGTDASDPYAGLDQAIREWRVELIKSEAACQRKTADGLEACQQFEVACKVEDPVEPREAATGVERKVLAAMTWTQPDPAVGGQRPASATAVFARTGEGWTREPAEPVNLRTCATFS